MDTAASFEARFAPWSHPAHRPWLLKNPDYAQNPPAAKAGASVSVIARPHLEADGVASIGTEQCGKR